MRLLFFAFAMFVVGCSPSATTITPVAPPMPTGPKIMNRDYKAWASFPVGTRVVMAARTTEGGNKIDVTETFELLKKLDDRLVITRQVNVKRSDGYKADNPSEERVIFKEFALPDGMTESDFQKPSLKAQKQPDEQIELMGKIYDCEVYSWTDSTESGPMKVTLWQSDKIPGGRAQQSMNVANKNVKTHETVKEIKIAE